MSLSQCARVWIACGFLAALYAANTWLYTQAGNVAFNMKLFFDGRTASALVALLIVPLFLNIGVYAGLRFAAEADKAGLPRLPSPFFESFEKESRESKAYRLVWLLLLFAFPILALAHFANVAADGDICLVESKDHRDVLDWREVFSRALPKDTLNSGYWLSDDCSFREGRPTSKADGNISWYPWLTPVLAVWLASTAALFSIYILRLQSKPKATARPNA